MLLKIIASSLLISITNFIFFGLTIAFIPPQELGYVSKLLIALNLAEIFCIPGFRHSILLLDCKSANYNNLIYTSILNSVVYSSIVVIVITLQNKFLITDITLLIIIITGSNVSSVQKSFIEKSQRIKLLYKVDSVTNIVTYVIIGSVVLCYQKTYLAILITHAVYYIAIVAIIQTKFFVLDTKKKFTYVNILSKEYKPVRYYAYTTSLSLFARRIDMLLYAVFLSSYNYGIITRITSLGEYLSTIYCKPIERYFLVKITQNYNNIKKLYRTVQIITFISVCLYITSILVVPSTDFLYTVNNENILTYIPLITMSLFITYVKTLSKTVGIIVFSIKNKRLLVFFLILSIIVSVVIVLFTMLFKNNLHKIMFFLNLIKLIFFVISLYTITNVKLQKNFHNAG